LPYGKAREPLLHGGDDLGPILRGRGENGKRE